MLCFTASTIAGGFYREFFLQQQCIVKQTDEENKEPSTGRHCLNAKRVSKTNSSDLQITLSRLSSSMSSYGRWKVVILLIMQVTLIFSYDYEKSFSEMFNNIYSYHAVLWQYNTYSWNVQTSVIKEVLLNKKQPTFREHTPPCTFHNFHWVSNKVENRLTKITNPNSVQSNSIETILLWINIPTES